MDLVAKVFLIAVVIVAVIAIVSYAVQTSSQPITRAQAATNVTNFIHDKWIDSNVTITSETPSQYQGSWDILAAVITNGTSPCPSYFVISFEYPKNVYNYGLQNNYTSNCRVNETTIGSYPVAIAKSYELNISLVRNFVNQYGYANVTVQATRVNSMQINGMNYSNVWTVYYTDPARTTDSVQVYLDTNGTLITAN